MRKNQEPYNIGLDIGTSSIGWSIMNDNFDLMRVKGKKGIGVYGRRKWRLRLLEDFFDEHMAEVDDTFFARLKDSNISPKDDKKYRKSLLFPKSKGVTYQDDGEFYKKCHQTVFHKAPQRAPALQNQRVRHRRGLRHQPQLLLLPLPGHPHPH